MQTLEKRLEELYIQKTKIEEEIAFLTNQIKEKATLNQKKSFSKNEKIELFKSLFVARFDIYAKKWVSRDGSKQGFFPVTKTFQGEDYTPLTNYEIEEHLRGNLFLASYCINQKNMSKFVVFEIADEDKFKLQIALNSLNIKAYYELSSYNSLFVWVFFEEEISSKIAFNFALYLLKKANISAKTYPNKEFATKENLGNCIELPLHLKHRDKNRTVFIDMNTNKIYEDQWSVLANVSKVSKQTISNFADVPNSTNVQKDLKKIEFPVEKIEIILEDYIYIPTLNLSKSLISKLKSFATFENPQIKVLLSLRKPLFNTPKYIRSFEENENFLMLPRGLKETLIDFFNVNAVSYSFVDKRVLNKIHTKTVTFNLRPEQNEAIKEIKKSDYSICVAPPGFGKTLLGAKIFEIRACTTLIVVNKNMLLNQWIERFVDYFGYNKKDIGYLGKGFNKLNGQIDVATMQSLKNDPKIIENYSFVIVDECHHIPALTFEQIIKSFKGKYILGLSATPNRKDELQPILFQQLGEISYEYKKKKTHTNKLQIIRTQFVSNADNYATIINELCIDEDRNNLIVDIIKKNIDRKILLLTDRIEHINVLESLLQKDNIDYISVHGSLNKKEQVENMNLVKTKSLILATTSYFGEGIDFPHLNTILFATPISYYGRLIQYLGRIGRGNQECLAIDFLDSKNAMLNSAYKKRLEGYKQMHYR
ncbi:DEAD/DEAH box helicase family protein [Aliarcobacter butzleri]|uniref:DEAD/DEAH box helicase family protein n=2 Tax=Aliarcobacter butzleri TaxID=28197 RepID=A0AAP4PYP4_9BACT|nr:DEAD/DEAH box helicase [Aliarcobacter butzleri]MDN5075909.1 DEAD/DEAH box helicase family protein [Aliarcobacter butzleri]MDN5093142.1 DEAD/DEAH box helicase family protein [Aliarcobacter butzleri]MDN5116399.1 DEAD/DEAH box helicase family protein [Aliarcobacter butzleri]MDN5132257.1 DEAD/DEAH box helicase family protein [Aliarcobacter butzleri]NUW25831.1 DEAD/DEAH box helicase family protein [Aliarcobacter butzleri]